MKRLIVCCDGTWQKLENPYPTNVVKMAQAVKPTASDGTPQIVFYDEGIGTGDDKKDKILGGAFGKGIDNNIQDGYRFLALNYVPGDEIYMFGFSRGSYTVRSLAGMIYNAGLLERRYIRQAPAAYELYRDRDPKTAPSSDESVGFRQKYGDRVPITLLACWDTVGSLGIPDLSPILGLDEIINRKYRFYDTTLNRTIQNALHAVAIDEHRKAFDVTPMKSDKTKAPDQKLMQVWFPGDHGCVGGGSEEQHLFSDAALQWTIDSMKKLGLGLDLDTSYIEPPIEYNAIGDFNIPKALLDKITQLGGRHIRKIVDKVDDFKIEDLHESVLERWRKVGTYRPDNLKDFATRLKEFVKNS